MTQPERDQLKCPACASPLKSIQFLNQAVEKCLDCGGMWFDADQIQRAQGLKDSSINWPESGIPEDSKKLTVEEGRKMVCPKDGTNLVSVRYGSSEVVVDICPECRGLWLDYGEFSKIAGEFESVVVEKLSLDYLKDFAHELGELFTGHKNFKEELKDVSKTWHLLLNRIAIDHPLLENFVKGIGKTFA